MTNYDDQVAAAASALKRGDDANWELARLTFENTKGDKWDAEKVDMAQWCTDVRASSGRRFGLQTGRTYRKMWIVFGQHQDPDVDLPPWPEAFYEVRPDSSAERSGERAAKRHIREATPERKAEIARELLSDPQVVEQVSDHIEDVVAADPVRTAHVVSKRTDAVAREVDARALPQASPVEPATEPAPEPQPRRDYDDMVTRAVDLLSVAVAAESSGRWKPSERTEALLYFLTQVLGNRREPSGEMGKLVDEKLDSMFAEVEAYANSGEAS